VASQLWQKGELRDYSGIWTAAAIRNLEELNNSSCYRFSLWSAPKFTERTIPEGGYRQSQVALPVGGYVWGFASGDQGVGSSAVRYLVTDLSLNRALSNAPLEALSLRGCPYILPDLYPIVAPGLIRVEAWNSEVGSGDVVAELVLLVVEPKPDGQ
jgi:hypothetical protein